MNSANKPKSLQDLIKRRQQSEFVGREEQVELFRQNLTLPLEDERRRFLFNVWGQGGVGKTYFLRRCRDIAKESWAITGYIDEDEKDVPSVMGRMAEQFKQQDYEFKEFAERYKVFRQKKQELEADPEAPQGFTAFVGRTLTKGALQLADQVPGANIVTGLMDKDAFANQMGDFASYVARRITNKDEVKLVLHPEEVLTPLFLKGLNEVAQERLVGLYFDTYEQTGEFLDRWLREVLEGRYGELPLKIFIVIAGREALNPNQWAQYEGLLAHLPLEPFTEDETRQYLARKGITHPPVVEMILRLSGRLPLLVATMAAGNPDDPTALDDPCDTAVERFLKWIDDPKRRQIALNAALMRRLNRDVLAELVGNDEADALFTWLRTMPFVQERTESWAYHDVVRWQMLRYKRRESSQGWAKLHGQLADYYEAQRHQLELKEEEREKNTTWQNYTIEVLYHRLCQSQHKYLSIALNEFLSAFKQSSAFVQNWAETIEQAGEDTENTELQRWGKQLVEGLSALEEKQYNLTIEMFSTLLSQASLEVRCRATALDWRGYLYYLLNQYPRALSDLSEAIQLVSDEAKYWIHRGETYRLMERYEEALADFNQAIALKPDYELAIALRGLTYRQMGRYEEALADFNQAITLKPDDEWAIVNRGETYRLMERYEETLADFNQAITLKPDDEWAISLRGETYRLMKRYEEALADFNQAITLKPDDEWAIASRGLTYRQMERYEEALVDFNQAIALKPDYEWAIANRGETYQQMERYEEALADFNQVLTLKPNNDWYLYLRALVYQALGQSELQQADITAAIQLASEDYQKNRQDWNNTFNLALYCLVDGEVQKAESLYREAAQEAPMHIIKEAISDLDNLLKMFSNYREAELMLEILRDFL